MTAVFVVCIKYLMLNFQDNFNLKNQVESMAAKLTSSRQEWLQEKHELLTSLQSARTARDITETNSTIHKDDITQLHDQLKTLTDEKRELAKNAILETEFWTSKVCALNQDMFSFILFYTLVDDQLQVNRRQKMFIFA